MEFLIGILRMIGDLTSALATAAISHFHENPEQK